MGILKQLWLEELDARGDQYPDEEWSEFDPLRDLDFDRRQNHRDLLILMTTDEIEFRYERRGDVFTLKSWHNGKELTERGSVDYMFNWLQPILDVAKLSGNVKRPMHPPPDEILWFRTDTDRNLITFIDLEDSK